jgi:GNAT superfamily N-acetyltransferase
MTKKDSIAKTANMNITFRKAIAADAPGIWEILQDAILRRKADGSQQWQDGYPNPQVVQKDLDNDAGYVLVINDALAAYVALYINDEPAYQNIEGTWLNDSDFVVFHRMAIAKNFIGQGLAENLFRHIEDFAKVKGISSIKADTNFDNGAMLHLFQKTGYVYCGEVYFRGSPRKAFEKIISQ